MSEANGDEFDDYSAMELWLHDLSVDSATRVAGALMIFVGIQLGALLGNALISANVGEILTGQLDGSDGVADVDGLVSTALEGGTTGGEPVEDVRVSILDSDDLEIGHDFTDSGGRFSIDDVPRRSSTLLVNHPGNRTVRIILVPGDHAQISVTLTPGDGVDEYAMSGESHRVGADRLRHSSPHPIGRSGWHGRGSRGIPRRPLPTVLVAVVLRALEPWNAVHRPDVHPTGNGHDPSCQRPVH